MKKTHKITSLLLTTVMGLNQLSYAQKIDTTDDGSVVTYEKDYFEKYATVTLLDMLLTIPGGKEIVDKNKAQFDGGGANSQGERGFGTGGDQILIDGKRLAGKSNNIDDTLSRISAEQVERIELIRGVTSGLDVLSQGLVINVVLSESGNNATTFWQVAGQKTLEQDFKPTFTISRSGNLKGLDYFLSVERDESGYFFNRAEEAFNANDIKTSDQNVFGGFIWESYKFNTNLGYTFSDNSQLRLNGLFEPGKNFGSEERNKSTNLLNPVVRDVNGTSKKWEFGGDYSRSLGALGNLKALFVINRDAGSETVNSTRGSGESLFEFSNEAEHEVKSEKIFRASITKGIGAKQTLELGGEAAINKFNKSFENQNRTLATNPFSLINSDDVKIKEYRYEAFANHTYNILNQLVLQSTLVTEFSKITADNVFAGGTPTRRDTSFTYFKPRVNLRYDVSDRNQIRATIEKKVSQLDFDNFVTSYDQEAQVFRFGNTNIRPEQIWDFSLEYEHRLANDGGAIGVEIFYRDYTDHITQVDFSEYQDFASNPVSSEEYFNLSPTSALRDQTFFTSKSGNVDEASSFGGKINLSKRLDFIGVPNAVITANYVYEKRRATDQFTGISRIFPWTSDHTLNVNFRHDITSIRVAYGFTGQFKSEQISQDINYFWPTQPAAAYQAFVEYNIKGIKIALRAENLTGKRSKSTFTFYNDHIKFNDVLSRTRRETTNWTEITLSIQGTF